MALPANYPHSFPTSKNLHSFFISIFINKLYPFFFELTRTPIRGTLLAYFSFPLYSSQEKPNC